MLDFSDAGSMPALTVDPWMIKAYILALFGDQEEGWVEFRGIHDQDKSITPRVSLVSLAEPGAVASKAVGLAEQWGREGRALFVCPAVLKGRAKATIGNLAAFTTVLVDLDEGDTESKRAKLQAVLGTPSMVVHSGGTTKTGHPKQHVYWSLSEAEDDITKVTILRGRMARYVGDDESFGRRATQIIRVAGSLHQKAEPRLVKLIERNLGTARHLMDLEESLPDASQPTLVPAPPGMMDFSDAGPAGTEVSRKELEGMTVEAGGQGVATRYDAFTKVAGGIIRDHDDDLPLAYEMVSAWMSARMSPPWDEKRMRQEFDALARKHQENYPDGAGQVIDWDPEARPPERIKNIPPLTEDMLPEQLREWVIEAAESASVPLEFIAPMALSTIGTMLTGRLCALPTPGNANYTVHPNIWSVVIAPPASRKSPAFEAALAPIKAIDKMRRQQQAKEEKRALRKAKLLAATKKAHNIETGGGLGAIDQIGEDLHRGLISMEEADRRMEEMERSKHADIAPAPPIIHTYMAGDANYASLIERCKTGPVMMYRDELAGLISSFAGDQGPELRKLLLEGHGGRGDYRIDRIGRGSHYIPKLQVGLCGGIQSGPWAKYVSEAKSTIDGLENASASDGFVQRFQLAVVCEQPGKPKPSSTDHTKLTKVVDLLKLLDQADGLRMSTMYVYNHIVDGVTRIPLSAQATERYLKWSDDNADGFTHNQALPAHMRQHYGKYDKLVVGLALIFYALDCAAGMAMPEVTRRHLELGIRWGEYMRLHAEAMYDDVSERSWTLLDAIKAGDVVDGMTTTEVYRMGKRGLRTAADLLDAVRYIPRLAQVVRTKSAGKQGGRPSVTLRINPNIQEILGHERA